MGIVKTADCGSQSVWYGLVLKLPAVLLTVKKQVLGCRVAIQGQANRATGNDEALFPDPHLPKVIVRTNNILLLSGREHLVQHIFGGVRSDGVVIIPLGGVDNKQVRGLGQAG